MKVYEVIYSKTKADEDEDILIIQKNLPIQFMTFGKNYNKK